MTKMQNEASAWKNQPICLQIRQMFNNFKNSFTSRLSDKCVVQ